MMTFKHNTSAEHVFWAILRSKIWIAEHHNLTLGPTGRLDCTLLSSSLLFLTCIKEKNFGKD